ncbi:hypothetical protein YTPLAS72_11350 [Nitrospira sp.]|nr:hypothetical protein YTPLAS72_11350 [Nitrospira sp.]
MTQLRKWVLWLMAVVRTETADLERNLARTRILGEEAVPFLLVQPTVSLQKPMFVMAQVAEWPV